MDVRQLLLLANDNSSIAKKKAARLDKDDDDNEPIISNDAVAAYVAKQKKFKEKLKAQEEAARRRRVEARLNASLKPTKVEKQQKLIEKAESGRFLPGDMRLENAKRAKEKLERQEQKEKEERRKEKELADKLRKKQEEKRKAEEKEAEELKRRQQEKEAKHRKRRSATPEDPPPAKKKMKDKKDIKSKDSQESTHRKEKKYKSKEIFESSLTMRDAERERSPKPTKQKTNKKVNSATSSMSFTDLMKLAKTNVATTRLAEDGTLLKKKGKSKTYDEEHGYVKEREKTKILNEKKDTQKSKHRDELSSSKSKLVNGVGKSSKDVNDIDCKQKSKKNDQIHNGISEKHLNHQKTRKEIAREEEIKCRSNKETAKVEKVRESNKIDKTSKLDKVQDVPSSHSSKLKDSEHRKVSKNKHDIHEKSAKSQDSSKENKHEKSSKSKENNNSRDSPPPVKRGLIAQTIATKKTGNVQPPSKITNTFRQVKPGKLSGIEAQCLKGGGVKGRQQEHTKVKMKKKPVKKVDDNYEDELDKEMRMLAKKRKMFEQRGTIANADSEEEMYDSEEDYDLSEEDDYEDDFIDDTEAAPDVTKTIRKITGYDRRVYDDSDEDVDNMESNYSQIMKEEARSARIAKEEDRIEALKEAEELARENAKLKQKEMMKKKKR